MTLPVSNGGLLRKNNSGTVVDNAAAVSLYPVKDGKAADFRTIQRRSKGEDFLYPQTQQIITDKRLRGVYPGVVYGFIDSHGEEVQAQGLAQIFPHEEQMTPGKRFDVASLTKVVCTTTVLLKLWEVGEIAWDQPLQRYLPEFKQDTITLRHLLTHTSDIQTWIADRDRLSAAELRAAYLTLAPGPGLGHKVQYTDAGTILLGFMLEGLFHQPVIDVFHQEVLEPLGMQHSGFLPKEGERKEIVPTERVSRSRVLRGVTHDPKARVLGAHAGNAGLFTDVDDLLIFCRMLLAEGAAADGRQFLQPETLLMLLQDQTLDARGQRSLGWDLRAGAAVSGTPALFHTGYTGTFLLADIAAEEAFVFLSNRIHPTDHRAAYLKERDEIIGVYQKERGART